MILHRACAACFAKNKNKNNSIVPHQFWTQHDLRVSEHTNFDFKITSETPWQNQEALYTRLSTVSHFCARKS